MVGVLRECLVGIKFLRILMETFFAGIPPNPRKGTMVDEYTDVRGTIAPPSGIRTTLFGIGTTEKRRFSHH